MSPLRPASQPERAERLVEQGVECRPVAGEPIERFHAVSRARPSEVERVREQQSSLLPVARHGALGQAERGCNLCVFHASEVAHLHDLCEARVHPLQVVQRRVHVEDLAAGGRRRLDDVRAQGDVLGVAAAAIGARLARSVDEARTLNDAWKPPFDGFTVMLGPKRRITGVALRPGDLAEALRK